MALADRKLAEMLCRSRAAAGSAMGVCKKARGEACKAATRAGVLAVWLRVRACKVWRGSRLPISSLRALAAVPSMRSLDQLRGQVRVCLYHAAACWGLRFWPAVNHDIGGCVNPLRWAGRPRRLYKQTASIPRQRSRRRRQQHRPGMHGASSTRI